MPIELVIFALNTTLVVAHAALWAVEAYILKFHHLPPPF